MKILILTPSMSVAGTARDAVEWANRLVSEGNQVTLLSQSAEGSAARRLRPEVKLEGLGGGRAIASAYALLQVLRKHASHAILANSGALAGLAVIFRRLGLIRNRIVFVDPFNPLDTFRRGWKTAIICRHLLWRADDFVHLSDFAEHVHLRLGLAPEKSHLIPNIATCGNHRTSPRTHGDKLRLLAVGRLDKMKGFDRLIRAFGKIAARRTGTTLRIVGEGCDRPRLEAIIHDLGLGSSVTLAGHSDDVASELCAADLFVLPSLYEGMPNTLVEALALGLRVVATPCRGTVRSLMRQIGAEAMIIKEGDFSSELDRAVETALNLDDAAWAGIHARYRIIFDNESNFNKLKSLLIA